MEWTKEQKDAIERKGSNILVSAAAGSGKTAVLVERIIGKILNDNMDIDKLLVVTFTNAAASEMREKIVDAIYRKLEEEPENERLTKQLNLLNKSNICTMHSFCIDVIRNNFFEEEGLSANFRIAEQSEIEIMKQTILDDLFDELYESNDSNFYNLINKYSTYSSDQNVKDIVFKIYNFIQSLPNPDEWLNTNVETFKENDSVIIQILESFVNDIDIEISKLKIIQEKLELDTELTKATEVISSDISYYEILKKYAEEKEWNKIVNTIKEHKSFSAWSKNIPSTETTEKAKNIREDAKEVHKKYKETYFNIDLEQAKSDIKKMYDPLKTLSKLVIEFSNRFQTEKREKNIMDFNDLEHYALKILRKEEVQKRYREKFEEIAIDEYQDTNFLQEEIMKSVSRGNNIFMVGDIKQSIYKFRNSRPELFKEKYNEYDDNKILLHKNFRSREEILDLTNYIFKNIMTEELGDVDYTEEEYLKYGANYPVSSIEEKRYKPELDIINLNKKKEIDYYNEEENEDELRELEKVELEANLTVSKIQELFNSNFMVFDKKIGEYRKLEYRDIVILLRATKDTASIYEKKILEVGFPVFSDTSTEYLNSMEISVVMSILKILDNPLQDIPLVCAMRSMIGGFTDNDLAYISTITHEKIYFYQKLLITKTSEDISKELKKKIDTLLNNIERWKEIQKYKSLSDLVWDIYTSTNFYSYVGLLNNGDLRQANLTLLFEKAKSFEEASFKGLFNFINFIEKLETSSGDMGAAKTIGENDNAIRIMSIHKSKGLEFPVVFLCGIGKNTNIQDLSDQILLHPKYGIGPKYVDYENAIAYNTIVKNTLKTKLIPELIAEEMRVFYVALTRAREKLILIGTINDYNDDTRKIKEELDKYDNEITQKMIKKNSWTSYLYWILENDIQNPKEFEKIIDINVFDSNSINESKNIDTQEFKISPIKSDENMQSEINSILNWKYPYLEDTKIISKTSVTAITHGDSDNISIELSIPKWKQEETVTYARKGTITHDILSRLDYSKDYDLDDINKYIDNLKDKLLITEKEAECINRKKILETTKSGLWKELKTAKQIRREEPFYIYIDKTMVQGIIDLYYINQNDELVLVDYKTDYVEGDGSELKEKYMKQLELYKNALEKSLNRTVNKVQIYSIYLNKLINF